jgi:hypothetical protein
MYITQLKRAVASSLLIICTNCLMGFASSYALVPINLDIVLPFSGLGFRV